MSKFSSHQTSEAEQGQQRIEMHSISEHANSVHKPDQGSPSGGYRYDGHFAPASQALSLDQSKTCMGKLNQRKRFIILIVLFLMMTQLHVYVGLYLRAFIAHFVPYEAGARNGLEHIVTMMPCMIDVLKKNDATWFMDEGSLLGAYRNKGVIPGDSDLDIALLARESDKFPQLKKDWERECNFYVVHRDDHKGLMALSFFTARSIVMRIFSSYWGPGWYVDIREYDISPTGVMYDKHFLNVDDTYFIPENDMLPTVDCEFSGVIAQCPRNSLHVVEELYGPEWNVPKKGFKTTMLERPTPLQLYQKAITRIKAMKYPQNTELPPPADVVEASRRP